MRKLPIPLLPRAIRLVGVVAVVAVIFYFSLLDSVSAPSPSPWWDKQLHLLAYAGLSAAAVYATAKWRGRSVRRGLGILLAVFAYGLGIELVQGQLAGRYFGFADLLANTVGTLVGGLWLLTERYVRYRRLPAKSTNP
ncbi:VanZ family protein [Halolamina salifodinae]|uniref:VanZ family protein n=1 Tax=Halolamina salifodinae TaxID=1202767 RepID=A0A8T4H3M3_9EURY|nr:VanZ family protein [Halolamina salifodinae]MBP1987788.1 VanZ family protein [Halolamina salifodinae]